MALVPSAVLLKFTVMALVPSGVLLKFAFMALVPSGVLLKFAFMVLVPSGVLPKFAFMVQVPSSVLLKFAFMTLVPSGVLPKFYEVRSQKFYLNIYTFTKLSNIFLDITFKRLNVMYSLYVYISRRLQWRHLSRYRATTSGVKKLFIVFLKLTEKKNFYVQYYGQHYFITYWL